MIAKNGQCVLVAHALSDPNEELGNTALAAAAPDLLRALVMYVSLCGNTAYRVDRQGLMEAYELAEQAFAKVVDY